MINIIQLSTPYLTSSLILFIMSCVSLLVSLSFNSRLHGLGRTPKDLSISVFNKTFNVFDPNPKAMKIIHSFISLLPIFIGYGALLFSFAVMTWIFQTGLVLSAVVFTLCFGLMMIDEAIEIYRTAGTFERAVKDEVSLGKGDLAVYSWMKDILPKLRAYYLLLATLFFVFSVALPYVVSGIILAFSYFVDLVFKLSANVGFLSPYLATLVFALAIVMTQVMAQQARRRVFGFSPEESLTSLGEQFERMKLWVAFSPHELVHRPAPEAEGNAQK